MEEDHRGGELCRLNEKCDAAAAVALCWSQTATDTSTSISTTTMLSGKKTVRSVEIHKVYFWLVPLITSACFHDQFVWTKSVDLQMQAYLYRWPISRIPKIFSFRIRVHMRFERHVQIGPLPQVYCTMFACSIARLIHMLSWVHPRLTRRSLFILTRL